MHRYVASVPAPCLVNALVPFATRLADDGLVHVRAWQTATGPLVLVAELDWPIQVADRSQGYSGPGIFTYPHYALPAALAACGEAGAREPELLVRLPAPPGERFARVTDPDDPQGWEPVDVEGVALRVAGSAWPGPPTGAYVEPVVREWIAAGAPPFR